jgi:hypothetical protein
MSELRCAVAFLVLLVNVRVALADGLMFNLPEDGTWAKYDVEGSGRNLGELRLSLTMKGTLYLASVGRVTEEKQLCRWIEVRFDVDQTIGREKAKKSDWWKVLIPEKYLAKGDSPLNHVIRAWYRSEVDDSSEKSDFPGNGKTPLPLILSGPLAGRRELPKTTTESKLGSLACKGTEGTLLVKTKRSSALQETHEKWTVVNRLHPASPFGVVASSWTLDAHPETIVWHLKFVDCGKGAKSKMPDTK